MNRPRDRAPRRLAIVQSNYIPWRGYFDLIASVDEFMFYDDVQYTSRDWRNRNRIKTPQGAQWLTVPVGHSRDRRIDEVMIPDSDSGLKHWKTLQANYRRARYFDDIAARLAPLYAEPWTSLSVVNQRLIGLVGDFLGIGTKLSKSSDHDVEGDRNGRLIALCEAAGADVYVSGPSAAAYLDVEAFRRHGIEIEWMDYSGYAEYPQLWGAFDPNLSILDLMFNCGGSSGGYMKYVRS